ncbi:hypothetical protein [Mannheimia haemolytica]
MKSNRQNKIGLSLLDNNRIRFLLDENEAILFELRSGRNGSYPYNEDNNAVCELEITDKLEQQKIIELATELATSDFGVQSLFYREVKGKHIEYETCFIDFSNTHPEKEIEKENLLSKMRIIKNLRNNYNFILNLKSDKCSQVQISFPIIQPKK